MISETIIVAVLAALGGGIGLEVLRRITPPAERRIEDQAAQRGEWRAEIAVLRLEVGRLASLVDEWQAKYYVLLQEHVGIKAELASTRAELEHLRDPLRAGRRVTDPVVREPPDPGMG